MPGSAQLVTHQQFAQGGSLKRVAFSTGGTTMNKQELVNAVAEQSGVSKSDVEASLTGMFEVVAGHVAKSDEKITVPGWISFERTDRKARKGRNPRTGESMDIPASKAIKVTAGSKLKKAAKGS